MRIVAVIPVFGRLPLLKVTIERLYKKNNVYKVICVGGIEEKKLCESLGAEFILHDNKPLGKKWNAGFIAAKKYNPYACLFVGSSDWVSDNWTSELSKHLVEYDMIGKLGFNLLDVSEKTRACYWPGYGNGIREQEPIGIGRILSARILEKLNWEPIDPDKDSSIDWSMYKKVLNAGGKIKIVSDESVQSLSISTSLWDNKHKFEDHYNNKLPSEKITDVEPWLKSWFPEGLKLFK